MVWKRKHPPQFFQTPSSAPSTSFSDDANARGQSGALQATAGEEEKEGGR